jgi:Zn-dependent peptidase ImmA (M78 family)/transcriptional regulator with XRE-family HTH domain
MTETVSPERLKQIRLARGLSLDEVAQRMDDLVTKQALSKYEIGAAKPRARTLARLAEALRVSPELLREPSPFTIDVAFRHSPPGISASERKGMENRLHLALEQRVRLQETLHPGVQAELPIEAFPVATSEGVEAAAEAARDWMQLGREPVANVVETLEAHHVHVFQWDAPVGFEGLSAIVRDSARRSIGAGIVLRRDGCGERHRFTAAHEFGHLYLKIDPALDVEKTCHRFAGAFLIPAPTLREEVGETRTRLLLPELLLLKSRFGISVQALLMRLLEIGIISRDYARQCFETVDQHGWKTKEPDPLPVERALRFVQSIRRAEAERLITSQEAAEMLAEREEVTPTNAMLALMQQAGKKATETARAELSAKGIAPVIWRDGQVVEEGE